MPENFQPGTGGIPSPEAEKLTAWTLASVGAAVVPPTSCFLDTDWMTPSMQAQQGCCVGCSGEECVRYIQYLANALKMNPGTDQELSFRFVFAMAKALEGTPGYEMYSRCAADQGTYPALVAIVLRKYGVPLAKFCPNDTSLSTEAFAYNRDLSQIPAAAITDAAKRKSGADLTEPVSLDGIKQAITYAKANKGAVMILRRIGDSYWKAADGTSSWDPAKILPIRVVPPTSGHEEFLTGYDTDPVSGRVRLYWLNHWSKDWANNGRGWEYADVWLPYIVEMRVILPALPPAPTSFQYNFTKQLKYGDKGADVVALQHVLELEGCYNYPTFTGNFLDITREGVIALQNKYAAEILKPLGLTAGTGIVASATLAWLNKHYGITK